MIGEVLENKDVAIVCGSGGVGKTTSAAAIATMAAISTEQNVLAITFDPARRLADALGVEQVGNEATPVSSDVLSVSGKSPKGRLSVSMLDTKESWDDLVQRHSPDPLTATQIMSSPLYRNITGRFVQSHDYIAMERLYELHAENEFDLIVIDTPPAAHAIDFLEAPARMADFFDSKLLKFLVAPSRSFVMNLTARPFLQIADRLLGKGFVQELTTFFTLLESMRPGFIERANQVGELLQSDSTTFVVVTTLESAPRHEAVSFIEQLAQRNLGLGAVVANRVLPEILLDADTADVARRLAKEADSFAEALSLKVGETKKASRVLHELSENFDRFNHLARSEAEEFEALSFVSPAVARVPWFEDELHDVPGLVRLGAHIW